MVCCCGEVCLEWSCWLWICILVWDYCCWFFYKNFVVLLYLGVGWCFVFLFCFRIFCWWVFWSFVCWVVWLLFCFCCLVFFGIWILWCCCLGGCLGGILLLLCLIFGMRIVCICFVVMVIVDFWCWFVLMILVVRSGLFVVIGCVSNRWWWWILLLLLWWGRLVLWWWGGVNVFEFMKCRVVVVVRFVVCILWLIVFVVWDGRNYLRRNNFLFMCYIWRMYFVFVELFLWNSLMISLEMKVVGSC